MCKYSVCILLTSFLLSCSGNISVSKQIDAFPVIVPDYTDVTLPFNIAPLNFKLAVPHKDARAIFKNGDYSFEVTAQSGQFTIPSGKWKKLLQTATGKMIDVTICVRENKEWASYIPFSFSVAKEPIDSYLVYRLIEPGYELWNQMGIYQRNLETYKESAVYENKMTGNNCVNCHSFCMQSPDKMLFHLRETYPGTILVDGDKIEKLNTQTEQTISPLVYPSWHPSGKFIAFSVNKTKQGFHSNHKNRVEVFDEASDVVVYDVEKHEIVTAACLFSKNAFETFPTFSPDGKTLFFCSAPAMNMPHEFEKIKYNLCAVSFNSSARSFGQTVDTLYNAVTNGQSASFPRVSPDGKYLLYTLSGYGNFSIWHKDSNLHLIDLISKESKPLDVVNSNDVESYHSWSSNSRWIVFSSRRLDGLYTRPFIAYIDNKGNASKPFLLPQKDTDFYHRFMKSYNIPEFVTGEITSKSREIAIKAKEESGVDVTFFK